jgi:glutaredoxin
MLPFRTLTPFRFRIALAVILALAFALLQFRTDIAPAQPSAIAWQNDGRLHVFFHPDCPHCHKAIEFLRTQRSIGFDLHDVSTAATEALLLMVSRENGIPDEALGVPLFVLGSRYLIG